MNYKSSTHLGIPFFSGIKKDFLNELENAIDSGKQTYAVTPNPEIMLAQSKDEKLRNILLKSDWNLPDGFGLLIGSFLEGILQKKNKIIRHCEEGGTTDEAIHTQGKLQSFRWIASVAGAASSQGHIANRICGSDIFFDICALSEKKGYKIFLLGGEAGVPEQVKNILEKKFPNIKIVGTIKGFEMTNAKETFELINKTKPNIIFLALGCPRQEYWINDNLSKFQFINFAIGIGGTFDFIVGKQKRAPLFLRKIGLEWLWRLILEPKRIGRIYNATIGYLIMVLNSCLSLRGGIAVQRTDEAVQ